MTKSDTKQEPRSSHKNPPDMPGLLLSEDTPGIEMVNVTTGNPRPANTPRGMRARAYNEKHNQHKSKVAKLRAKFRAMRLSSPSSE